MLTPALIHIIVYLVIVGLVVYLIDLIPMDGTIKTIIRGIIIVAVIIWLLQAFGLIGPVNHLLH
jgi:hypothetical protein